MGVSLNTEPCPLRQIWGAGLLQSDHTPDPAQTASLVHITIFGAWHSNFHVNFNL